jgi:hypothetical protein
VNNSEKNDILFKKSGYIPNSLDDENNEFGYIWSIFGLKPSKVSIHLKFDSEVFWESLNEIKNDNINYILNGDILNENNVIIKNYKHLISLEENIYLSFIQYSMGDNEIISNIIFYFNSNFINEKDIDKYVKKLFVPISEIEEKEQRLFYMTFYDDQLEIQPLSKIGDKVDVIGFFDKYQNKKEMRDLFKNIDNDKNGLYMIYSDIGQGKTTFVKYIIQNTKKDVVIIPINLAITFLTSLDFIEIIRQYPSTLFIIDDFNKNIPIGQLYQLNKGVLNGNFNSNFLVIYNDNKVDEIKKYFNQSVNVKYKKKNASKYY